MLSWPWKRFEDFFAAFSRRKAREELDARRQSMVTGVWANPNYDDDKGSRAERLRSIEDTVDEAIGVVYGDVLEHEIDKSDPLFGAMKVPDLDQETYARLAEEKKKWEFMARIEVDQE